MKYIFLTMQRVTIGMEYDEITQEISDRFEKERVEFINKHRPDLLPCREVGAITTVNSMKTHLPLELFFPKQLKKVHIFSIRIEKSVFSPSVALVCFSAPRGDFYFVVQLMQTTPAREIYLMDAGCIDSERSSAYVIVDEGPDSFLALTAVNSNRCVNCNVSCKRTLKCSKCWENLCLRVVYCCKQCQVANFSTHKALCGKEITEVNERVSGPQLVMFSRPPSL